MKLFTEQGKIAAFYSILFYFLVGALFFCKYYFFLQSLSYLQKTLESFITKTWARKRLRGLKLGKLESWIYIIKKTLYITFNPLTHKVQNFLERMFCNHFFAAKIEEYSIVDWMASPLAISIVHYPQCQVIFFPIFVYFQGVVVKSF